MSGHDHGHGGEDEQDHGGDDPDDAASDAASEAVDERAEATPQARVADLAAEYEAAGTPFARVTVVRREPPVSANVGDTALVTADGDLVGWVGGADCAQSVAVKEAQAALTDGEPRLVGLAPDPADVERPGLTAYPMTCHSGGTLELFVEPVRPRPRLAVVGTSPIARALVALAPQAGYDVALVTTSSDDADVEGARETVATDDPGAVADAVAGAAAVVVASVGEYDDLGVEGALRAGVDYVGLVASDRRHDELAREVAGRLGADAGAVAEAVTSPAGLDIGAKTPEEIALAVVAELVARRRGAAGDLSLDVGEPAEVEVTAAPDPGSHGAHGSASADDADAETVTDPVCGMDVTVGEEAAAVDHGGETYRFCGQGCADAFAADPESYLEGVGSRG